MPDLEARLRAVEDRDAIRELTARYCFHAVRGDAEQITALFTDDAEAAAEVALTVDPADDYYLNYTMKETMNMLEQYLE